MDCVIDWPEPVEPVQSESEGGAAAVPTRYIKPVTEHPCFDGDADPIPVVDLSAAGEASAVSDACRGWGFFPLCDDLKRHQKWPALAASLRKTVEEYGRELGKLSKRVVALLSAGLGLEEERMQRSFGGEEAGACARVNYYPKSPQPAWAWLGCRPAARRRFHY